MKSYNTIRIGADIADERDFERMQKNKKALGKIFTQNEIATCQSKFEDFPSALTRRFAAKEALIKARGKGAAAFTKIEILNENSGKPVVSWSYLTKNNLCAEISFGSAYPFAVAFAVIYPLKS